MKKLFSTILFIACAMALQAQPSKSYYNGITGKKGATLKNALYSIISSHTNFSYSSLWYYYEQVDYLDKTNSSGQHQVFDMYSTEVHYFVGNGGTPSGMNKEHTVPKSWWSGTGPNSDIINVLPSETQANSNKSNYPLGVVTGSVSTDNGRIKTGKSSRNIMVVEPVDEYKGDFARIYFYVATCYPSAGWKSSTSFAMISSGLTLADWIVDMLLEWNEQDPPSTWEATRNNRVEDVQGNRNPFIDYPELANYIWGSKSSNNFDLSAQTLYCFEDGTGTGSDTTIVVPDEPDTPDTPTVEAGDTIFYEPFDDVTEGDNVSNSGSSKQWSGNDNIVSTSNVYQAGGAIRVGTGKKTGSITTRSISCDGGSYTLSFDVKGWTSVEGTVTVTIVTGPSETVSYTATMSDDFEHITLNLTDMPSTFYIIFETSTKRCFIDNICVVKPVSTGIVLPQVANKYYRDDAYYNLYGLRLPEKPTHPGIYIHHGKKYLVK